MRVKVEITLKKQNMTLPFDYQYFLSSYIYRNIEKIDPGYALDLHLPKKYKFFTFSYLMIPEREINANGITVKSENIYFFVSSPNKNFIKTFVESILSNPEIKIKNLEGIISQVKIIKKPEIKGNMLMKTISPLLVRKPVKEYGKLKGKELFPTDPEFTKRLKMNLIKKFCSFNNIDEYEREININFLEFKTKRHKIIDTFHKCVLGKFIISGDKKLIEFGYDCGFGEKNSMGFGMVQKVSHQYLNSSNQT